MITRSRERQLSIDKTACGGMIGLIECDQLAIKEYKEKIVEEVLTFSMGSTEYTTIHVMSNEYVVILNTYNHRIKSTRKQLTKLYDDAASYLADNPLSEANMLLDYLAWAKVELGKVPEEIGHIYV